MAVFKGQHASLQMIFHVFRRNSCMSYRINTSNKRAISVSLVLCKKEAEPPPKEALRLRNQYPDPCGIVSKFLQPITSYDPGQDVQLGVVKQARGWWKVSLRFNWPLPFTVHAMNENVQEAETNAYLRACEVLTNIGLLRRNGEQVHFTDELMRIQDLTRERLQGVLLNIHSQFSNQFMVSQKPVEKWSSTVTIQWPVVFTAHGEGKTQADATRNAAVFTFIKLKGLGCLDNCNQILPPSYLCLPHPHTCQQFRPHYAVYSDASFLGYGAILYARDGVGVDYQTPVPWICEHWPTELQAHFMTPNENSTVFEFAGILSAVYTWKKKFEEKNVLVYSDNQTCCMTINRGLNMSRKGKKSQIFKMFKVLRDTCIKQNIRLKAEWVDRSNNQPADALSKLDQSKFRSLVPNAKPTSKKTKKILFCLPLVESNILKET